MASGGFDPPPNGALSPGNRYGTFAPHRPSVYALVVNKPLLRYAFIHSYSFKNTMTKRIMNIER